MHRPRMQGQGGGVGEVNWAEDCWRTDRERGWAGEQGGPRAPPTLTGSLQEQEGPLSQKGVSKDFPSSRTSQGRAQK